MDGAMTIGFVTLGTALVLVGFALRAQRRGMKRSHSKPKAKDPRIARMQRSVAADAPTEVLDMDALLEDARTTEFDRWDGRESRLPPPVPVAALKARS